MRKLLRYLLFAGLLIIAVAAISIYFHPILFKWFSGTARVIGMPEKAMIYVNGVQDKNAKVYHVSSYCNNKPADYYLLVRKQALEQRLRILLLHRDSNYTGIPSATSRRGYDTMAGILFQSETGANFTLLEDKMKGYG